MIISYKYVRTVSGYDLWIFLEIQCKIREIFFNRNKITKHKEKITHRIIKFVLN